MEGLGWAWPAGWLRESGSRLPQSKAFGRLVGRRLVPPFQGLWFMLLVTRGVAPGYQIWAPLGHVEEPAAGFKIFGIGVTGRMPVLLC